MRWLLGPGLPVAILAAIKLAVHLFANRHYGYFVDELYYLACSEHLDWGYVDQPPLIALITYLSRAALGDSLSAIRFLPALAGAVKIILTGLITRDLGGGRFAQGFAALCVLVAPGFLAIDNWLSMNPFEPLFWLGCACVTMRIVKTGDARLWLVFGALAGIGLENKHSMLIFGFALVVGLLLTPQRAVLGSRWLWAGGALVLLLLLPNLVWNIQHHFPFLELQANIRASGRNVALSPVAFFKEEALAMMPLALPVWLAGIWFFFRTKDGRPHRWLGWTWVVAAALIIGANPRIYYLFPAFPILFAGGSVQFEQWAAKGPRLVYAGFIALAGVIFSPLVIPVLPVETFIAYTATININQPKIETHQLGPLPQLYADQFGWDEMAAAAGAAYNALPPDLRARTAIFGQNYGQAGAIDFFGPKYGLPKALSGHQNYYLWGPRGYTGESVIVLGDREERLRATFQDVKKVATVYHPYSMPYQHFDVYHCTGIRVPLKEVWPRIKNWR